MNHMRAMGMASRSAPPGSTSGRPLEQHALRPSSSSALPSGRRRAGRAAGSSSGSPRVCTAIAFDERQATVGRPFSLQELRGQQQQQQQQLGQQGAPPAGGEGAERSGDGFATYHANGEAISSVEKMRRSRISAANKGRSPWNLGRQHSEETKAKIRERTFAAMQRPEVRERLKAANEHRVPHSDSTKEKIRVSLQARAARTRAIIADQADLIVAKMAASEDEEMAAAGVHPKAATVVAGLAWQHFKRGWESLSEEGWDGNAEFRERVVFKITNLGSRRVANNERRKRKGDRVRAALQQMKRLALAEAKMADVEVALAKLQRARAALVSDPANEQSLLAAEISAVKLLSKLREQVATLKLALEPLQQYLEAGVLLSEGEETRDASEQRVWELRQAQRAKAAAASPASSSAVGGVPGKASPQPASPKSKSSLAMPWSVDLRR